MKTKSLFPILFLIFLSGILFAQDTKPSFLEKKNQHVIEADIASLSYSFAHRFSPKLILGARFNAGFSLRFLLTDPSFYHNCDQCDAPDWERVKAASVGYFDVFKFQLFYRYPLHRHFYFDAGPYFSLGFNNFEDDDSGHTIGVAASAMYTIWLMHIGLRMQAGWQFFKYGDFKTNYFGVFITPIVIGFNF